MCFSLGPTSNEMDLEWLHWGLLEAWRHQELFFISCGHDLQSKFGIFDHQSTILHHTDVSKTHYHQLWRGYLNKRRIWSKFPMMFDQIYQIIRKIMSDSFRWGRQTRPRADPLCAHTIDTRGDYSKRRIFDQLFPWSSSRPFQRCKNHPPAPSCHDRRAVPAQLKIYTKRKYRFPKIHSD